MIVFVWSNRIFPQPAMSVDSGDAARNEGASRNLASDRQRNPALLYAVPVLVS
jgi:hypothetical protein